MGILKKREIKRMSPEERRKKLDELRAELMRLRTTIEAGGRIDNPSRVREIRRTMARLLTVENQRRSEAARAG